MLLLRVLDPWDPSVPPFWVAPGGGVAPGEPVAAAAARELAEETGFRVPVGPCVGLASSTFRLATVPVEQVDHLYVAWLREGQAGEPAYEGVEEMAILEARWWTAADLAATAERVVPAGLAGLVADLADGRVPGEPRVLGR